ncbi:uncharacterized protein LOC132746997 [Ruditapes philippinarum]|uniref:uncharacterized protein LOC132746997 n=1 Tax=Ruditapes philippinarum TaxID=129788 RepID=UPI00295A58BA|nr:uncharacterized protein LOC132746997 [Ruditapes philippinarum]
MCVATCKDNSVFLQQQVDQYTCTGNGTWTPSDFIPDCVLDGYSECPIWKYNVTWTLVPDECVGIQCDCEFTSPVEDALNKKLANNTAKVSVIKTVSSNVNGEVGIAFESVCSTFLCHL